MEDFAPSAKVIADSISPTNKRLTTIEVTLHRYMLPEFNTHRVFSRNSASSRAIPVHKIIERITTTPVLPLVWASEQKGMQGGTPLDEQAAEAARAIWLHARYTVIEHATALTDLGVHKSIVNRLLEPFMDHTVVVTSTDYDNFFAQRATPPGGTCLAQPEIAHAADAMRAALNASTPTPVELGDLHLPYLPDWEAERLTATERAQVSAARCARVSYLTQAGTRSIDADLNLYLRLVTADPPHLSPLEHVATPAEPHATVDGNLDGNLDGWHQLRHLIQPRTVEQP